MMRIGTSLNHATDPRASTWPGEGSDPRHLIAAVKDMTQ
jgi:hypothetical protein